MVLVLSIPDKMWNAWILYLSLWLCSLVSVSQQTPVFSPSLFSSPSKNSTCPPNASARASRCTSKLIPLGMVGPFFNESVSLRKALDDGCVQGHFFDAVNCMERVMLDCRYDKSDAAHSLRSMMNVENTRNAIVFFCTNIDTYLSNMACVRDSLPKMSTCGQKAKDTFMTQKTATSNIDSQMRFQCSFYSSAVDCAESVLMSECNEEIANLVFKVTAGMEPPICAESIYSIAAKGRKHQRQRDEAARGEHNGDWGSGTGSFLEGLRSLKYLSCGLVLLWWQINVRW